MFNEYKKFLKENQEFLFLAITSTGLLLFIFFIPVGVTCTFSTLTRHLSNSKQLEVYRENLATFQKCAEKVTDASLVETYCGSAPYEPILIW